MPHTAVILLTNAPLPLTRCIHDTPPPSVILYQPLPHPQHSTVPKPPDPTQSPNPHPPRWARHSHSVHHPASYALPHALKTDAPTLIYVIHPGDQLPLNPIHVHDVVTATAPFHVVLLLHHSSSERYMQAAACRFRAAKTFQNSVATMLFESAMHAFKPPPPSLPLASPLWTGPLRIRGAHNTILLPNFELIRVNPLQRPSLATEHLLQASEMRLLAMQRAMPCYGTITNAHLAFQLKLCQQADTATGVFVDSWIRSRLSMLVQLGEAKMWCYWRQDSASTSAKITCRALLLPPLRKQVRTALAESVRFHGGIAEIPRDLLELPRVKASALLTGGERRNVTWDELDDGSPSSRKRQRIGGGHQDVKSAFLEFVQGLQVPITGEGAALNRALRTETEKQSQGNLPRQGNCARQETLRLKLRVRPEADGKGKLTASKFRNGGLHTELGQNQLSGRRQASPIPPRMQEPTCKQDLDRRADNRRTEITTVGPGDAPKWSGSEQRKRPRAYHPGVAHERRLDTDGNTVYVEGPSSTVEMERLKMVQDSQGGGGDPRKGSEVIEIQSSSEDNIVRRKETENRGPPMASSTHSISRNGVSIRSNRDSFQTGATRSQRTRAAMEEDRALRNRLIRARYERLSRRTVDPSFSRSNRRTYPYRPQYQPKRGQLVSRQSLVRASSNNVAYAATTSLEVLDSLGSMRPFFKYGESDPPVSRGRPRNRQWRCIGEEMSRRLVDNSQGEYDYPPSATHGVEFALAKDGRDAKLAEYEKLMAHSGREFASMKQWDQKTASRVEKAVGKLMRLGVRKGVGVSVLDHLGDASRYLMANSDRARGAVATGAPVENQLCSSRPAKRRSAHNIEFPRFEGRGELDSIGLEVPPRKPLDWQGNDRRSIIGPLRVGNATRRRENITGKRGPQLREELPLNEGLELAVEPKNSTEDCMRTCAEAGLSGDCGTGTDGSVEAGGFNPGRHSLVANLLLALQKGELREADRRLLLQNLK